jgi:hypothetical protein
VSFSLVIDMGDYVLSPLAGRVRSRGKDLMEVDEMEKKPQKRIPCPVISPLTLRQSLSLFFLTQVTLTDYPPSAYPRH